MLSTLYIGRNLIYSDDFYSWVQESFDNPVPQESLHVTQMYSKQPVWWPILGKDMTLIYLHEPEFRVEHFGTYTVLVFDCDWMQRRWADLMAKGCSYDFPSYNSHITVSESISTRPVTPYIGDVILGVEEFKPLDPNWNAS